MHCMHCYVRRQSMMGALTGLSASIFIMASGALSVAGGCGILVFAYLWSRGS